MLCRARGPQGRGDVGQPWTLALGCCPTWTPWPLSGHVPACRDTLAAAMPVPLQHLSLHFGLISRHLRAGGWKPQQGLCVSRLQEGSRLLPKPTAVPPSLTAPATGCLGGCLPPAQVCWPSLSAGHAEPGLPKMLRVSRATSWTPSVRVRGVVPQPPIERLRNAAWSTVTTC